MLVAIKVNHVQKAQSEGPSKSQAQDAQTVSLSANIICQIYRQMFCPDNQAGCSVIQKLWLVLIQG